MPKSPKDGQKWLGATVKLTATAPSGYLDMSTFYGIGVVSDNSTAQDEAAENQMLPVLPQATIQNLTLAVRDEHGDPRVFAEYLLNAWESQIMLDLEVKR